MTSAAITDTTTERAATTDAEPRRWTLKPPGPATGEVDGAWWPRSRDLAAELPTLLAGLADRLGRTERISYNLTAWDPAPRRTTVDGRLVRLAGYHTQNPASIDVLGATHRLTLLVVPPQTPPHLADDLLAAAGRAGNVDRIVELARALAPHPPTS